MTETKNSLERRERQEKLWKIYAEKRDPTVRERIILEYVPLIKYVAGRLAVHMGSQVDYDDMLGYGVFGLMDAIDKFDYTKGVLFESYASLRIRGEIIDGVRKLDWVPRTLRKKSRQLEQAYSELENDLCREPTYEEFGDKLGCSVDEVRDMMAQYSIAPLVSLDDIIAQNSAPQILDDSNDPDAVFERNEITRVLADVIDKLKDRERLIITLYYYEEMTLTEISATLGVTQSRVSQIHSEVLLKLRAKLRRYRDS